MSRAIEPALPLTAFLTDASIVAVCEGIGHLGGVGVTLRDHTGRRVVRTAGEEAWDCEGPDALTPAVADALTRGLPAFGHEGRMLRLVPMKIESVPIGTFLIDPHPTDGTDAPPDEETVDRCVRHLAHVIDEFCQREVILHERNEEVELLYRLSSRLAGARDAVAAAEATLNLLTEFLTLPAATIHLLSDRGDRLELTAQVGLDDDTAGNVRHLECRERGDGAFGTPVAHAMLVEIGAERIVREMERVGYVQVLASPLVFQKEAVGVLRLYATTPVPFTNARRALVEAITAQSAETIARTIIARRERHTQRQIRLAGEVQRRMLPERIPQDPRLDIAARSQNCFDIGGDFYDAFELDGRIAIVLADVVGKGIPAGLLMASTRASLRAHAHATADAGAIMQAVSDDLSRDTLSNEFATVFLAIIDPETGDCEYCNAGHEQPRVFRENADARYEPADKLRTGGLIAGVYKQQPYEVGRVVVQRGDVVVAVTDGVIDAMNFENERFGRTRLKTSIHELLTSEPDAGAKRIADHIIWQVRRFIGLNPRADDMTVVALRRAGGVSRPRDRGS